MNESSPSQAIHDTGSDELADICARAEEAIVFITKLQRFVRRFVARQRLRASAAERQRCDARRSNVAKEILSTERTYVTNLESVVAVFVKPLKISAKDPRKPCGVTEEAVDALFSCTEIILSFNEKLCSDLDKRITNWSPTQVLGDVFKQMAPWLKVYTSYVNNYPRALDTLRHLQKNSSFTKFMVAQETKPQLKGLKLTDFLIMPIQRIPRYEMLLNEYMKNTPKGHRDHDNMQQALLSVRQVAQYVNERKREAENRHRVIEVRDLFNSGDHGDLDLVAPSRQFVRESEVNETLSKGTSSKVRAFLFTDILVTGKRAKFSSGLAMRSRLQLAGATVREAASPLSFLINTADGSTTFECYSAEDRSAWMLSIRKVVSDLVTQEAKRNDRRFWSLPPVLSGILPAPVAFHSSCVIGTKIYILGGIQEALYLDQLYCLETSCMKWTRVDTTGSVPMRRYGHAMLTIDDGKRILVFGGSNDVEVCNDMYVLDVETNVWTTPTQTGHLPPPVRGHTLVLHEHTQTAYLFGGRGVDFNTDVFALHLPTLRWSFVPARSAPSSREHHTAVVWEDQMIVFGGANAEGALNDTCVFDLLRRVWVRVDVRGTRPITRYGHCAAMAGCEMHIIGGCCDGEHYCDVNVLRLSKTQPLMWEQPQVAGDAPTPRSGQSCACLVSEELGSQWRTLYLIGGYYGSDFMNEVALLHHHVLDVAPPIATPPSEEPPKPSVPSVVPTKVIHTPPAVQVDAPPVSVKPELRPTSPNAEDDVTPSTRSYRSQTEAPTRSSIAIGNSDELQAAMSRLRHVEKSAAQATTITPPAPLPSAAVSVPIEHRASRSWNKTLPVPPPKKPLPPKPPVGQRPMTLAPGFKLNLALNDQASPFVASEPHSPAMEAVRLQRSVSLNIPGEVSINTAPAATLPPPTSADALLATPERKAKKLLGGPPAAATLHVSPSEFARQRSLVQSALAASRPRAMSFDSASPPINTANERLAELRRLKSKRMVSLAVAAQPQVASSAARVAPPVLIKKLPPAPPPKRRLESAGATPPTPTVGPADELTVPPEPTAAMAHSPPAAKTLPKPMPLPRSPQPAHNTMPLPRSPQPPPKSPQQRSAADRMSTTSMVTDELAAKLAERMKRLQE
eukprot:TRINITY_DN9234_c0_g1_i1.p1 TRINITY_DN9234_c0_g1~~TRINITY_DN9234_c0_g1_i1.p1  ORF type:complete len:1132 (-),score=272.22 TRINITY_DN9234_c0_g1_i1:130-3525(-)